MLPILAISIRSCKKRETATVVSYKGIVLYNVCGNVVLQTIGPNNFGENNWTDNNNPDHPVYNHVFTVANACSFGMHSSGDTINFTIVAPEPQTCAQCLIYVATPETSYPIRVIK